MRSGKIERFSLLGKVGERIQIFIRPFKNFTPVVLGFALSRVYVYMYINEGCGRWLLTSKTRRSMRGDLEIIIILILLNSEIIRAMGKKM